MGACPAIIGPPIHLLTRLLGCPPTHLPSLSPPFWSLSTPPASPPPLTTDGRLQLWTARRHWRKLALGFWFYLGSLRGDLLSEASDIHTCLEAQQRYFSYRAICVAIVSQNSFVLVLMGYRTIIARYIAKWGMAQMCLCQTNYRGGGGIAPFLGSDNFP